MRYSVKTFDKSKQGAASIARIDIEAHSAEEAAGAVAARGLAPLSVAAASPWAGALLQPRFTQSALNNSVFRQLPSDQSKRKRAAQRTAPATPPPIERKEAAASPGSCASCDLRRTSPHAVHRPAPP